nr:bifunctional tetrahydrofolate synthase/dihydrofolate synthase [Aestuariibacter sp. A3R04]
MAQWLSYLESIHPTHIDLGLARVKHVADVLALNFTQQTVITVAGTNGKGTTCRFIEQALLAQGKTTGVYASPHLLDYRERIRINGEMKDEQYYCAAFEKIEKARGDTTLTYFEFGTLAAMVMMAEASVEFVILEVGLGGRLDATNIIDPDLAVITTIGLDHMDWLGDTREKIALEKAGIMRQNGSAVIGELAPPDTLSAYVVEHSVDTWWANSEFAYQCENATWQWTCPDMSLGDLPLPRIPVQNAATALAVLKRLDLLPSETMLHTLLEQVSVAGRRQTIASSPDVLLDVAHNPQACALMRTWAETGLLGNLHLVVGMLADKSLSETLAQLSDINAKWYVASTEGQRGLHADSLVKYVPQGQQQVETFPSVTDAYLAAREKADTNDRILVFGSFLTVTDVLAYHRDDVSNRSEQ